MNRGATGHATQSGMTLIELVVVLALMAALATVMLTGVSELGNRGRYDETTTRMRLIREAVIGNGSEPGRFIRDMGRLPIMHTDTDGVRLAELWRDQGDIDYGAVTSNLTSGAWQWTEWTTFGHHLPDTVELVCGWNGPYLMVDDPTEAESYDGFGNAWRVDADDDDCITNVTSRGSDNADGSTTWDEVDRSLNLAGLLPETSLTVLVKARNSTNAQDVAWRSVVPTNSTAVWSNTPPYCLHKLHVTLFYPKVTRDAAGIGRLIRPTSSTNVSGAVLFDDADIRPTDCRVYAYGYLGDPAKAVSLQVSGNEPELVRLNPGHNIVTLYLREP
jgi:prepilin-type N-terminal cleavage/methylation domain-containing protein